MEAFIDEAAEAGVDVFRIFDSLNDLDSMQVSIRRVLKTGKVAEVAMCYTGDVANPKRTKYTLDYYADGAAHRGRGRALPVHQGHGGAPWPARGGMLVARCAR